MANRKTFVSNLLVPPQGDHLVLPHNLAADYRLSALRGDPALLARTDFNHGELPPDLRAVMNADRWDWLRGLLATCEKRGDPLPWNPPTHFYPRHSLPGNADLVSGEELASLKRRLRTVGTDIYRENGGSAPFALLDFYDKEECFTTRMLKQVLRDIFGDDYPKLVNDELRANLNSSDPVKTKVNKATGRPNWLEGFNRAKRNPRVWVMGGTFNDADDVHGEWFQENVMTPLLVDSQYVVALCWAYQVMVRALAKQYGLDIFVLNGSARWGAFPVGMRRTPAINRAFDRNMRGPLTFTAGFTHSDHVVFGSQTPNLGTPVFGRNEAGDTERVLDVIARDGVTGLPAGYLANDGRVAAFAFHPEIELRGQDLETVQAFIRTRMKGFFESRYRVHGTDMEANFAVSNKAPFSNLGEPFYTALLLHFAEKLLKDVRRGA